MINKINYQKQLDDIIDHLGGTTPKLLLHACCAPCSSYCLEYLSQYFEIGVLYYNPNISPASEYEKRINELKRLVEQMPMKNKVTVIDGRYVPSEFYDAVKGLEKEPEGGARCMVCYELRLKEAALYAKQLGFDYFTTTLTISPLKSSKKINDIGQRLQEEYGVKFLPSDFKKKEGFKRSIQLSHEYNLYRQNYCGCEFSKSEVSLRKVIE